MKITFLFGLFFTGFLSIFAQDYDPFVEDVMNQTDLDSLISYVRILSGEDSVVIGDSKVLIEHRVNISGNDLATEYLKDKLGTFGLDVHEQKYSDIGRNVYAIQPGSLSPEQQFIICAHYDAVHFHCADDNASGVAAVLESARILSDYQFNYTIIYALWDEEESLPKGSLNYAEMADSLNSDIRGVLNLDMIGWDGDDDGLFEIHTEDYANSVSLSNLVVSIDSIYALSLNPLVHNPGAPFSDHHSFWRHDYSAIWICEAFFEDRNPHYHSSDDRIDKFNLPYFFELAKLGIGSISTLAINNLTVGIEDNRHTVPINLNLTNFPNPFNNSTTIHYEIPEDGYVVLSMFNNLGENVTEIVNEYQKTGKYKVRYDADNLSSGTYILIISTPISTKAKKIILLK